VRGFKLIFDNRYSESFGAVSASRAITGPGAIAEGGFVGA
jgi:hypothetical protein